MQTPLLVHEIFKSNFWMTTQVAKRLWVKRQTVDGIIQRSRFRFDTKIRFRDAINDLLGTNYTIHDLFSPATDPATDPEPAHS